MPTRSDQFLAFVLAVLLHALGLLLVWLGRDWTRDESAAAAGPVISATLQFSAADVRAAQKAIAKAQAARPPPPPTPPPQPRPQAPLERPDTVDQEAITAFAPEPSESPEEQRARARQAQVDLTEDIERQKQAEERARLQEQIDAIRREREEATKRTQMEEQRLAQLADRQPANPGPPSPRPAQPASGRNGTDTGLLARYRAAMLATAKNNWNSGLATEGLVCHVRFTQIPGGEVINIEFMDCPYDAQGRESVERALRKTPMPYSGFEPVFDRQVPIDFCYPDEACPQ